MGLGLIELAMALEKEFQIAIPDSESDKLTTVGDAVDYVFSRVRRSAQEPCPSQHGFYVARRQLMAVLAIPRSTIKPETRMNRLIPPFRRKAVWREWQRLGDSEAFLWPPLSRPLWPR